MGEQAKLASALLGSAAPLRASRPKWTFRKSSQCWEGPSQSLHPLRGQKHIKKGLQGKGCLHRKPQNPGLCPGPTEQRLSIKQGAHFPCSVFSHPPPPAYTDSENGRQTEKERCLKSDRMQRPRQQHSVFLYSAKSFKMLPPWPLLSKASRMCKVREMCIWGLSVESFKVVFMFEISTREKKVLIFCVCEHR